MRIVAKPGRYAAAALGVTLAAAGLLAAGAPAIAAGRPQTAGASTANHGAANHREANHRAPAAAALPGPDAPWQRALSDGGLTGPGWPQKVPRPGNSSELNGIYCTSSTDCWAVGEWTQREAELNQALHWNGKGWARASIPNPGGTGGKAFNELFGVRCLSPKNCWTVGEYDKGMAELSEALRWNGKRWHATATPNPGGTGDGDLSDLFEPFCASANSCWAVGDYGTFLGASAKLLNLAVHWNGKHWSKAAVPSPAGSAKGAISELASVACLSARDCWAAGEAGRETATSETTLNEALHWNGKRWAKVTTPNPAGAGPGAQNALENVTCFASANCWAVGEVARSSTGPSLNEAMRWTGHKWALHKTPDPGGLTPGDISSLSAARCPSGNRCWAVGFQHRSGGSNLNQLLRWNGTKWATG